MRYSITNATAAQVKSVGATNVKAPTRVPVVFADLTDKQVQQLRAQDCSVSALGKVRPVIFLDPVDPGEVPPEWELTPIEIETLIGLEDAIDDPPPEPELELEPEPTPTPAPPPVFEPTPTPAPPPSPPLYGKGLVIAIIDTGISR